MDVEAHVVHASRTKAFFLLVLSIGFVSLGLWFLSLDPEVISARNRYNNPTIIYALGWATVLFFGLAAVAICWRLVSAKPAFTLDNEGVTLFSHAQETFVPWQDVSGLSVFEIHRTKMLVLNLRDPERYIEKGGAVRRSMARANYRLCGSPIAITSAAVKLSFRELQELFEAYVRKYSGSA